MKRLKQYLAENTTKYVYFVKFANKPTDDQVESIKSFLKKYDLVSMSNPELVDNGSDFIDLPDRSVHSCKIEICMPIGQAVLFQEIKNASDISEKLIVLRSENEPIEQYAQFLNWENSVNSEQKDKGNVPSALLGVDREYFKDEQPNATDLYGNEYNKKLLTYLAGVANSRPTTNVEPPAPLFSWLDMLKVEPQEPVQSAVDYNANIPGAPQVITKGELVEPVDPMFMTSSGAMSNASQPTTRFFRNEKTGELISVKKPVEK